MTRRTNLLRASSIVATSAALLLAGGDAAFAQDALSMVSASVFEADPPDPENVAGRIVVFTIETEVTPTCGAGAAPSYGFLIDADRNPQTRTGPDRIVRAPGARVVGRRRGGVSDLGVDARVSAVCDPASGAFSSDAGLVTVTEPSGDAPARIQITTAVGLLPSIDFDWVAYAVQGRDFRRLPEGPSSDGPATHGTFRTFELAKN